MGWPPRGAAEQRSCDRSGPRLLVRRDARQGDRSALSILRRLRRGGAAGLAATRTFRRHRRRAGLLRPAVLDRVLEGARLARHPRAGALLPVRALRVLAGTTPGGNAA